MTRELLDSINRACQASISYGYQLPKQEVIPTGIPQLDAVIGGGVPRGRIIEIFGAEASGKTALALHMARHIPGPALYVDADRGLSPYMVKGQDLYLLRLEALEETLDACFTAAVGGFGCIVLDTVTAIPTKEDTENSINEIWNCHRGLQAKVLAKGIPILNGILAANGCTLIVVSQLRNKPGIIYGRPDKPASGNAIKYFSALRLETRRIEVMKDIGQVMQVDVRKCKYSPPSREAKINLIYGKGLTA